MRLIHLHDIALLAARLSSEEWQQLTQLRVAGRPMWWAVPPLTELRGFEASPTASD
jgi:hypothetical protein